MSKKVSAPNSVEPELEVKAEGAPEVNLDNEVKLDNDEVKAPEVDGAAGAPKIEPEIEPKTEPDIEVVKRNVHRYAFVGNEWIKEEMEIEGSLSEEQIQESWQY